MTGMRGEDISVLVYPDTLGVLAAFSFYGKWSILAFNVIVEELGGIWRLLWKILEALNQFSVRQPAFLACTESLYQGVREYTST